MDSKRVDLYDSDRESDPPESLVDFITWLTGLLAKVPDEFRGRVRVEMAGCDYFRMEVYYDRPLTFEESQKKLAEEHVRIERRKAVLLAELKKLEEGS